MGLASNPELYMERRWGLVVLVVSDCVGLGSDGSLCFVVTYSVVGFSVVVSNSAVVSDHLKGLVFSA